MWWATNGRVAKSDIREWPCKESGRLSSLPNPTPTNLSHTSWTTLSSKPKETTCPHSTLLGFWSMQIMRIDQVDHLVALLYEAWRESNMILFSAGVYCNIIVVHFRFFLPQFTQPNLRVQHHGPHSLPSVLRMQTGPPAWDSILMQNVEEAAVLTWLSFWLTKFLAPTSQGGTWLWLVLICKKETKTETCLAVRDYTEYDS